MPADREGSGRRAVVRVNEAKVLATGAGADWWTAFRWHPSHGDRVHVIRASLGGDLVDVPCDSLEDAKILATHMVGSGTPLSAVSVRLEDS